MKKILMIASAAAMAMTMPSLAQAQGKGKGASMKAQQSQNVKRNAKSNGQVSTDVRGRTDARANARARTRTGASVDRLVDRNGDGVINSRDRFTDRNRDGVDDRAQNRYGGNSCPPGLAKKTPACVPPGQANRMFREGQRLPSNYRDFTAFNDIPELYRDRIPVDFRSGDYRYVYRDNSIYVVDPTTRVVRSIVDLLIR
jgi:hypothetical protein